MLFKPQDLQVQRFFIDQSEGDDEHKQRQYEKLKMMERYANTDQCLQQFILNYFGQSGTKQCGRCSNCLDDRESVDVTVDAQKVLSCVVRLHERFGKGVVAQVLAGAQNQRVLSFHLDQLSTYGLMSSRRQRDITTFIDFLAAGGYLETRGGQYPTLGLTAKGAEVLRGQAQVFQKTAQKAEQHLEVDDTVFQELRSTRRQLAEQQHLPPYMIFSDKTLKAIGSAMPQSLDELMAVKGVGQAKLDKYGQIFLDVLQAIKAKA